MISPELSESLTNLSKQIAAAEKWLAVQPAAGDTVLVIEEGTDLEHADELTFDRDSKQLRVRREFEEPRYKRLEEYRVADRIEVAVFIPEFLDRVRLATPEIVENINNVADAIEQAISTAFDTE